MKRRSDFSTMISSLAPREKDIARDRLCTPARQFKHPDEVLRDGRLEPDQKRTILSSWASDACAVESMPALRRPPGAAEPVPFDTIMDALRELDAEGHPVSAPRITNMSKAQRLDA